MSRKGSLVCMQRELEHALAESAFCVEKGFSCVDGVSGSAVSRKGACVACCVCRVVPRTYGMHLCVLWKLCGL